MNRSDRRYAMLLHQEKKNKSDGSVQDVIPLYYRVYEIIRKQIERGDYPEDKPLPGEHELANRFEVSRVTIRRTMRILEEAGMITRLRGRGTFINPEAISRIMPENYSGFDQNIKDFEGTTKVDVIDSGMVKLPAWAAETVGRSEPVDIFRIEYTRSSKGVPFSYIKVYLPDSQAEAFDVAKLGNKTVTSVLEEAGTIVVEIDQKLTAVGADQDEARRLHLPLGEPLIRARRVMFDASRDPVQFVETVYNPKFFEYHISLSREMQAGEAPRWVPTSR